MEEQTEMKSKIMHVFFFFIIKIMHAWCVLVRQIKYCDVVELSSLESLS